MLFFYPHEFEESLLKKEIAFKGLKEDEIKFTKFKVTFSDGKSTVEVVAQEAFPQSKKPSARQFRHAKHSELMCRYSPNGAIAPTSESPHGIGGG